MVSHPMIALATSFISQGTQGESANAPRASVTSSSAWNSLQTAAPDQRRLVGLIRVTLDECIPCAARAGAVGQGCSRLPQGGDPIGEDVMKVRQRLGRIEFPDLDLELAADRRFTAGRRLEVFQSGLGERQEFEPCGFGLRFMGVANLVEAVPVFRLAVVPQMIRRRAPGHVGHHRRSGRFRGSGVITAENDVFDALPGCELLPRELAESWVVREAWLGGFDVVA